MNTPGMKPTGGGFPEGVLSEYAEELGLVDALASEKNHDHWCLSGVHQGFALWEYRGDRGRLVKALQWQEYLKEKSCPGILTVVKTKEQDNFLPRGEVCYYLTEWPVGTPLDVKKSDTLPRLAEVLAAVHHYGSLFNDENHSDSNSNDNSAGDSNSNSNSNAKKKHDHNIEENVVFSWIAARQERLTELLQVFHYLLEKGPLNDFERLYVENFLDIQQRGQEALEKMALAGADSKSLPHAVLLGNLSADNFWQTEKGIYLLKTTGWRRGPVVSDLGLLLKMYLPLYQWDWEIARETITQYQAHLPLVPGEKNYLLGLLTFPGRFLLYARRFFSGGDNSRLLTEKLKKFLNELSWQEQCLVNLEQWLWGEGGAKDEAEKGS